MYDVTVKTEIEKIAHDPNVIPAFYHVCASVTDGRFKGAEVLAPPSGATLLLDVRGVNFFKEKLPRDYQFCIDLTTVVSAALQEIEKQVNAGTLEVKKMRTKDQVDNDRLT